MPTRGSVPDLPGPAVSRATGVRPLLVLHGSVGSPGNFGPLLSSLADVAQRTVCAPPYGGRGTAPLGAAQNELLPVARRLAAGSPDGSIDVVGHSLGGLHGLLLAGAGVPVRRLVGLGACFRGLPAHLADPWLRRVPARGIVRFFSAGAAEVMTDRPGEVPGLKGPLGAVFDGGLSVVSVVSDADRVVPEASSDLRGLAGVPEGPCAAPGAEPGPAAAAGSAPAFRLVRVHGVRHENLPQLVDEVLAALQ